MEQPKQVLVIRKDLHMTKGKIVAQAAHASLKVIIDYALRGMNKGNIVLEYPPQGALSEWLFGTSFKKICTYVESEKELDMIYESAKIAKIPTSIIVDSGLTHFKGVPTKTCVAVGPAYPHEINPITGHLPLL